MTVMGHLVISPQAGEDLLEIGLYITDQSGSGEIARRFLETIHRACEMLADRPGMGELRREFRSGEYRSFSVGNYVVYFRPMDDGISVARILHGARDHESLL
jgi:toxin ParE1/3/4